MLDEVRLSHGVMEGKGSYNKHVRLTADGAALAIPFLEEATRRVRLEPGDQPVVIADYGSSQGKNSLGPMEAVIRHLRPRLESNRPIFVFHVDQPTNDFNSLFEVLSSDPNRYTLDAENVFPCAIGRSFYEGVLPPESVHIGWCSYAAVWLRRAPSLIPGHFFPASSTGAVRATFERQGAEDWEVFLSLRAREMRPGARLVVVLPTLSESGSPGFREVMNHANAVLAEMAAEGTITAEERAQMVLGAYTRRKDELLAPFTKEGRFQQLTVEDYDLGAVPDGAWADYQRDGDKEALATKRALFFRAVFMPSLAVALAPVRNGNGEALKAFADRLQDGLTRRVASHPEPADMAVQTIVLAKTG